MITLLTLAAFLLNANPDTPEPVVGLPCEGCENVFVDMPDDLTWSARIAPCDAEGEAMVVDGTVRHPDGTPAGSIIVYAYQTDDGGIYPTGSTFHGSLRAWVVTDAEGRYRFHTIRPGNYPGRDLPQHIHMHVIEPGKATYYIDDITFTDDPKLPEAERTRTVCRAGCGVADPERDDDGTWHVRRDIVLGEAIPGYPG